MPGGASVLFLASRGGKANVNTPLLIALCDDTKRDLKTNATLVRRCLTQAGIDVHIEAFQHPDDLLSARESKTFDLYLLDVVMPMLSGIELGKEIRRTQQMTPIIFLTTSNEFAIDAFAVDATHYLVKPFTEEQLAKAMERVFEKLKHIKKQFLTIKTLGGPLRSIAVDDINYIECHNHILSIHSQNEVVVEARRSLARLQEELETISPAQFLSPYKGYIVNMKKIALIEPRAVVLRCGFQVPLPRGAFRDFQMRYVSYQFNER